ncbi:hypothetical protein DFA_00879 [Cavenderia fasciculata]|uniref:Ankyrin repeat-containing protein n=1 Tax=Cavenderia fasciculata TaxID=261658 RepID=F4PUD8_CACFS|nr:uncharacterized protein DFA_00879 [Cavenderia fasciculata]EGG21010.1 hypothetical protein DFA_00879 [Cavenderia fasciculata]|eukprot:XP_004358860.1 hypothetical protein DFA_00879 [Cavenderia fasciculata]
MMKNNDKKQDNTTATSFLDRTVRNVLIENKYLSRCVYEQLGWINIVLDGSLVTMLRMKQTDMFIEYFDMFKSQYQPCSGLLASALAHGNAVAALHVMKSLLPSNKLRVHLGDNFRVSPESKVWDEATVEMMNLYFKTWPSHIMFVIHILKCWVLMDMEEKSADFKLDQFIEQVKFHTPYISQSELDKIRSVTVNPSNFRSTYINMKVPKPHDTLYLYTAGLSGGGIYNCFVYKPCRQAHMSILPTTRSFQLEAMDGDFNRIVALSGFVKRCSEVAIQNAATSGNLDLIIYLINHYSIRNTRRLLSLWYESVRVGHIHVLEYLLSHNIVALTKKVALKSIYLTMDTEILSINLEMLQFILDRYQHQPNQQGYRKLTVQDFSPHRMGVFVSLWIHRQPEIITILCNYFGSPSYSSSSNLNILKTIACEYGLIHSLHQINICGLSS